MARRSRIASNCDAMPGVKLFVVSTGWPYRPTWQPQSPVVLLVGGPEKPPQYAGASGHVCLRYSELVRSLVPPDHGDIFIVDLAETASPAEWREELVKPGRATKMLSKWFIKFNPSNALVLAHGEDAGVATLLAKMMDPGGPHEVSGYVERVVVVAEDAPRKWTQRLAEICKLDVVQPTIEAVSRVVAARNQRKETVAAASLSNLHFVQIDFKLDPFLKSLKQTPVNISATVLCPTGPIKMPTVLSGRDAGHDAPDETSLHHLDFGMRVSGLIVQVLSTSSAGTVTHAVLADSHSSVEALVPQHVEDVMMRGCVVKVGGRALALEGRLFLAVEEATPHSGIPHGYSSVRLGERSLSQRKHRYGCLLLRGTTCVLVRRGERCKLPMAEPSGTETKQQAATRAVVELCHIYPEEITLLRDVHPAITYATSAGSTCVCEVFVAVAGSPPEAVASCCGPVVEDEAKERYRWYDFNQAFAELRTEWERISIMKLTLALTEAVDAGIVAVDDAHAFRPARAAIDNELSLPQLMALMPTDLPSRAMLTSHNRGHGNREGHSAAQTGTWDSWECAGAPSKYGTYCAPATTHKHKKGCCNGKCSKKGCC